MPCTATGRFRVEMIPAVTVESRPYGDPTATTPCPTLMSLAQTNFSVSRSYTFLPLITATSAEWSAPPTAVLLVVPSLKQASRFPLLPPAWREGWVGCTFHDP